MRSFAYFSSARYWLSRLGRGDARAAAGVLQRLADAVGSGAGGTQRLAGPGLLRRRGEQEVLGRDVVVLQLLRLVLGAVEELREPVREVRLRPCDLRDGAQLVLEARDDADGSAPICRGLGARSSAAHSASTRCSTSMAWWSAAARFRLSGGERLLGLHGELFRSHGANVRPQGGWQAARRGVDGGRPRGWHTATRQGPE